MCPKLMKASKAELISFEFWGTRAMNYSTNCMKSKKDR